MCLQKLVNDNYNLDVIGLIGINSNVYKVKCSQQFYCLKIVDNRNIEMINNHIITLKLNCFVQIILNKQNHVLTQYHDRYFYLMEYLEMDKVIIKEIKLKHYLEYLAYLHNNSFFNHQIDHSFFDQQCQDLRQIIKDRYQYYDDLMTNFEQMHYRSPSGWMLVLNFNMIKESLTNANKYLEEYYNYVKDDHYIRLSLIYNNFNYNHIYLNEHGLISINHIKIDYCIYDIYNIYQQSIDLDFNYDALFDYYLKKVKLKNNEKLLLKCLLSIVPIITFLQDEVDNIIKMSRLLQYLNSITNLNNQLTID